jgi:NAD-dependent SIR2 family protein deacetylase
MMQSNKSNDNFSTAEVIQAAAHLIADADALIITSGAGIGIDSGLPDFRGENGFWNACPW